MAAEHTELVMEMQALEKMPHAERVKHAKKRRLQQLKVFQQYEKKMEKEIKSSRKSKPIERGRSRSLQFAESTLLFDAAIRNDVEEAESHLQCGVSPNLVGGDSLSVLHQCCLNDLPDMMKLFIRYGADVNSRDCDLWTPLHLAATCGNIGLCQCLCDNNADLLALNTDGNMPYDLCDDMATLDFIESEMAKKGITQELIDETRLTSENEMLNDVIKFANQGGDLNFKGSNGETLLHIAACMGYGRVIDFLLSKKVPVNCTDNDGWQVHHMATYYGQYHVLESILLAGADPYAKTNTEDTMLDLCDFDAQPKVQALILDVQNRGTQRLSTPSTLDRNNSTRRGSQATLHPARRSSIHDKASIAHREAIMEGQRLQGSFVVAEEEDEDEAESDFIEIPAITVSGAKTSDVKVEAPRAQTKSILKQPSAKTTTSTTKSDFKVSDIWSESKMSPELEKADNKTNNGNKVHSSPTKNQNSSGKTKSKSNEASTGGKSNQAVAKSTSNHQTSPVKNGNRNNAAQQNTESNKQAPASAQNSSKQHNGQAVPVGTLADLKNQRKLSRDGKQSNGTAQNRNSTEGLQSRDSKKNRKFSNQNEVVSGDDNKCCVIS